MVSPSSRSMVEFLGPRINLGGPERRVGEPNEPAQALPPVFADKDTVWLSVPVEAADGDEPSSRAGAGRPPPEECSPILARKLRMRPARPSSCSYGSARVAPGTTASRQATPRTAKNPHARGSCVKVLLPEANGQSAEGSVEALGARVGGERGLVEALSQRVAWKDGQDEYCERTGAGDESEKDEPARHIEVVQPADAECSIGQDCRDAVDDQGLDDEFGSEGRSFTHSAVPVRACGRLEDGDEDSTNDVNESVEETDPPVLAPARAPGKDDVLLEEPGNGLPRTCTAKRRVCVLRVKVGGWVDVRSSSSPPEGLKPKLS